jgi:hypothetical protein
LNISRNDGQKREYIFRIALNRFIDFIIECLKINNYINNAVDGFERELTSDETIVLNKRIVFDITQDINTYIKCNITKVGNEIAFLYGVYGKSSVKRALSLRNHCIHYLQPIDEKYLVPELAYYNPRPIVIAVVVGIIFGLLVLLIRK